MNVGVVVATYGDSVWQARGVALARRTVEEHAREGVALTVRVHPWHDTGLQKARNLGAVSCAADGADWLCFLDADDELEPGYFDAMNEARYLDTERGPVLLQPAVRYVRPDGSATVPMIPNRRPPRPLWEINTAVIGTLVPASLFADVGGFRDWPVYEDWDLWLRCVKAGARLVDAPAAVYRAQADAPGRRNRPGRRVAAETYWAIRDDLGFPPGAHEEWGR